jgi:hypothetical protein
MFHTTVSRTIFSPSGRFAFAVAIILGGAALPGAGAQPPDAAQLKEAAEQRGQRAESYLRPLDANRNGLIEASEVNDQAKNYLARTAERYGVQATFPLAIDKYRSAVVEAYLRVRGNGGPGGPPPGGPGASGGGSPTGGSRPGGLGMAQNTSTVSGFGISSSNAAIASSTPNTTAASSAVDERYRAYAANMLKRYDKNGNGALDRDEWNQLRGEWWKSADANNDGTITVEEIVGRLAGYRSRFRAATTTSTTSSSGTPPNSTSSSYTSATTSSSASSTASTTTPASTSPSASSAASPTATTVVRKPYRFLTPTERLPAGLPEWFARRDANGDGQVTLAEFSSALTDEVVAEFARFDRNNDGVVTPKECLDAAQGR